MRSRRSLLPVLLLLTARATAQPADPLREHYERAQSFQLAGELDRAEAEYRQEVLPRALRRLGNLSGAEARLDESVELLEAAAGLSPADVDVRIDLAVAHLRRGDLTRAASVAEEALAAAPRSARARSVLGRIRLLRGDPAGAASALRQSLAEEPRFETAYALALASLLLDRVEAARALFDQMLGEARNVDVLLLVGRAYLEAGRGADAAPFFAEALERSPGHGRAKEYLAAARSPVPAAGGRKPPGAVLIEMLPAATGDAARRAETREQLERVLASAWHNLTVIYTKQGRPDPAGDAARQSARWERRASDAGGAQASSSPAALHALGLARAGEGRHDEAEALLRRAVTLDPALGGAWLALARLYVERGDAARALEALEHVPADEQTAAMPVRLRALLAHGRLAAARAIVASAAARADAGSAAAILDELSAHGMTPDVDRFLAHVPPAVASAPDVRLSTARFRLRQGDREGAERVLRQVLASTPRSLPALQLLATIASERSEHDAATDLLLQARAAGGDTPELLRALSMAAAAAGRVEDALAAARRLVAIQPDEAAARYLLGVTLLQNQLWEEAAATLAAPPPAAAADPRWPAALGMAHFGARDYDAAQRAFDAALQRDGSHVEARYHLGLIAREQGRTADAMDELRRVISIAPDHAPAHGELGALYLLQNDLDRARVTLERAVALDPDAPAPHYQLGLLHARTGDVDRARREMKLFEDARAKSLAGDRRPVIQQRRQKGGHDASSSAVRHRVAADRRRLRAGVRADDG